MQNINTIATNSFDYSGNVTIKIQRGDSTVKTYNYTNNGNLPLYEFLANCVAGKFYESQRPTRLVLFTKKTETNGDVDTVTWSPATSDRGIFYAKTPVITRDTDSCTATLHFVVPYSVIYESPIAALKLYSADSISDSLDSYSAVIELDPVIDLTELVSRGNKNYSLIVDWKLTFKHIIPASTPANN